jgi:hypothetical protein
LSLDGAYIGEPISSRHCRGSKQNHEPFSDWRELIGWPELIGWRELVDWFADVHAI